MIFLAIYLNDGREDCEWPNSETDQCKSKRKWIYSFDKNEATEIDLKK